MSLPMRDSTREVSPTVTVTSTQIVGHSHTAKVTVLEDYVDARAASASLLKFKSSGRKAFVSRIEHKRGKK